MEQSSDNFKSELPGLTLNTSNDMTFKIFAVNVLAHSLLICKGEIYEIYIFVGPFNEEFNLEIIGLEEG